MAFALDGGSLITGAKSLIIGGSAAAKVAATVAAVSTTVVATEPVVTHYRSHHPSPSSARGVLPHATVETLEKQNTKPATRHVAPAGQAGRVSVAAVVPRASRPAVVVTKRHRLSRHVAHVRASLPGPVPAHDATVPDTSVAEPVVDQPESVVETDQTASGSDRRLYSAHEWRTNDRTRDRYYRRINATPTVPVPATDVSAPDASAGDTTDSTPQSDQRTRHRWWRRAEVSTPASSSSTSGERRDEHEYSGTSWRTDGRYGDTHHTWDGTTQNSWDGDSHDTRDGDTHHNTWDHAD